MQLVPCQPWLRLAGFAAFLGPELKHRSRSLDVIPGLLCKGVAMQRPAGESLEATLPPRVPPPEGIYCMTSDMPGEERSGVKPKMLREERLP